MALRMPWADDATGVLHQDAYHRVDAVAIDTRVMRAAVRVSVHRDQMASGDSKRPVGAMDFSVEDVPGVPAVTEERDGQVVELVPAVQPQPLFTTYFAAAVPEPGETMLSAARRRVYEFLKAERQEFAGAVDV